VLELAPTTWPPWLVLSPMTINGRPIAPAP
jgi:hypothetical protein